MKIRKKKSSKFKRFIKILLIFILVCFLYSLVEPYLIEEQTIIIQDSDIPQNFSGKKIVFVSDIHHGRFFDRDRVADIVARINRQNPDLIILGGDYIYGDTKYIEPCFEELSKLEAPLGVYAVTGNHDEWENYRLTLASMKKAGITILGNDAEWIEVGDEKIRLNGIGWSSPLEKNEAFLDGIASKEFSVLVAHDPGLAEELEMDNIDLMLSGHNHGGQMTLFGLWAFYLPSGYGQKYLTGIIEKGDTKILVSNGIGNTFVPMRFFARPQINIVILKK
ncbi:MAG: metallophosphoesterase [Candidatus Pacebacteria bacterium]|nr:metallophosphoesterase [Candidatus Paceibacterota bacterium]